MAETTADVRRDIEMTRERMSETLDQLEQKMNVMQIVRDHPWPAIAVAVGAGVLLSGSRADVKAAAATVTATRGASGRLGSVLDDVVANLMAGVSAAFAARVDGFVDELKVAIGAPATGGSSRQGFASGSTAGSASAFGGSGARGDSASFGGQVGGSEPFSGATGGSSAGSSGTFGSTGSAGGAGMSGSSSTDWNRAD